MVRPIFLCLLISLFVASSSADEIHGCGGFVQASSGLVKGWKASDSKLDYSDITVELCTTDGLVKERTQCAPNGYYFMPVYDKGSFIVRVKGPKGWSWDPEKVPVTVDHNGCNQNADINFKFTGFMLAGRVVGASGGESCASKNNGPAGVRVDLLSPSGDLISHSLTSKTGEYSFPNVIPGKYKLRASHPDYEIETRKSPEVDLGFGNARVDDLFFVSGYNIYGSIVAQGNPILGVNIYLYSKDVSNINCPKDFTDAPKPGAICHTVSDEKGNFVFNSVPCGSYELVPYYKGENTVFDVSPASLAVSVEHNHLIIPQKFQVTGFSIGGRVVDSEGVGIENARVILDGQFKTLTDNLGFYKLDQVTSKPYSIVAEKDHYKFSRLENFMILPNMASVEEIKAVSYNLCGFVRMISSNSKARVALTSENMKPQSKLVDKNGWFCFEVPAGEYQLAAVPVGASDSSATPVFSPSSLDVKIQGPVLNLEFFQTQVSIFGEVICKEKCGTDISLTLVRAGGSVKERKTVKLGKDGRNFAFSKVLPGKYTLEIKHREDKWCWEKDTINLDVGPQDLKGIIFTQKGYNVDIISTHPTNSFIKLPDSSKFDVSIRKGPQRICLESPGQHELHFVNKCIQFEGPLSFDTRNPDPLIVRAEKYLVTGEVQLELDSDSEEINVDVLNSKDGSLIETIMAKFVSKKGDKISVYEYSIWASLGDSLVFVPKDSSTKREKKILFYPTQTQVSVSVSGCQKAIPPISARPGLYISGQVTPALSGVKIQVFSKGQSGHAQLKENELAAETETDSDGKYSAGPLYDDISYKIEASKEGYHVKQTGDTTFTCQKLGQISVRILSETETEIIPSVLLSLSGDNGYRNNTVGGGTAGAFSFADLFPGSFYLRPVLKEYSFSPRALAIELESGESKVIEFRASRVAFSAMGSVKLLSGQPKAGAFIEARSETDLGFYEESVSDASGNFRLRGLVPDTTYLIRVVTKRTAGVVPIERSSPESIPIKVGNGDTKDINFIIFEIPETPLLSGHVDLESSSAAADLSSPAQHHLSVEVRSSDNPSRVETVISLPLSNYFEIRELTKSKHLIQLRSSLPSNGYEFESDVLEVDLESQTQVHVGPIRFKIREKHHKQDVTAAPLLPLIVGVSVIILFISMPRLNDFYQMAVGMKNGASSPVAKKDAPRKASLRKRA
ncbi:hypothetical protein LUZ60_003469 [Juncus effusus]|nr:hypothetical protein LUZ60_003469 [Juncus effusus]